MFKDDSFMVMVSHTLLAMPTVLLFTLKRFTTPKYARGINMLSKANSPKVPDAKS